MKVYIKSVAYIIGLIIHTAVFAQKKCGCCTYNSIDKYEYFETFFSPNIIKEKSIKLAIFYTDEIVKKDSVRFLQSKFIFNPDGTVNKRYYYNRGGKPHSVYTYKRNLDGLITQITFNYVDSLENIASYPEITDLEYSVDGKLTKFKERDYSGEVLPDAKSIYTDYTYDTKGNLISKYEHSYYGDNSSNYDYVTTYTYDSSYMNYTSVTTYDDKEWMRSEVSRNKWKLPVLITQFSLPENKMSLQEQFEYDKEGRIVIYKVKLGFRRASECANGGHFIETYEYNDQALVTLITHKYSKTQCKMRVEYEY